MAAARKQSRPTVPAMPDPAVRHFEERIKLVGENKARIEHVVSMVQEDIVTEVMKSAEIEALRARCLHD